MLRIGLLSLVHERGKLVAAVAGVAFAAMLVLAQTGIYVGFKRTASAVISHVGGDLWVMARGTEVLDNSEPLAAGSRMLAEVPCVRRVRGLVFAWTTMRKPSGALESVQVVGYDPLPGDAPAVLPWSLARGVPADLHGPMRVSVDALDLTRLEIRGDPIGAWLDIGPGAHVGAVTYGIRAFTLAPYLFAEASTAQRLTGMAADQYSYWIVDLEEAACADAVARAIERHPELVARRRAAFQESTETYWVDGSGAGGALGFSAVLGLVVGIVVVGQTLYSMTKEHLKELATLKAMGATDGELVGFVAAQAVLVAGAGGTVGIGAAFGVRALVETAGLQLVLSPGVLALGVTSILVICIVACAFALRRVLTVDPAEVFK